MPSTHGVATMYREMMDAFKTEASATRYIQSKLDDLKGMIERGIVKKKGKYATVGGSPIQEIVDHPPKTKKKSDAHGLFIAIIIKAVGIIGIKESGDIIRLASHIIVAYMLYEAYGWGNKNVTRDNFINWWWPQVNPCYESRKPSQRLVMKGKEVGLGRTSGEDAACTLILNKFDDDIAFYANLINTSLRATLIGYMGLLWKVTGDSDSTFDQHVNAMGIAVSQHVIMLTIDMFRAISNVVENLIRGLAGYEHAAYAPTARKIEMPKQRRSSAPVAGNDEEEAPPASPPARRGRARSGR